MVVFGGDLRQTLPVVEYADGSEIVASSVTFNKVWTNVLLQYMPLGENIRANLDVDYHNFLLRVGDGVLPYELDVGSASVQLPERIVADTA